MVRTQIYLTEAQNEGLKRLAATSGRRQSELIRDAIEEYLADQEPKDWKAALRAVRGMWADRDDLADLLTDSRRSWDDRLERLYEK